MFSIVPANYVINTDAAATIPNIFNTFITSGCLSLLKAKTPIKPTPVTIETRYKNHGES